MNSVKFCQQNGLGADPINYNKTAQYLVARKGGILHFANKDILFKCLEYDYLLQQESSLCTNASSQLFLCFFDLFLYFRTDRFAARPLMFIFTVQFEAGRGRLSEKKIGILTSC